MTSRTSFALGLGAVIILGLAGLQLLTIEAPTPVPTTADGANVTIVDGTQIVTITAKGGYWPKRTTVKAGMPTVLRFVTKGSFDCSTIVRVPSLGITRELPPSGATDVPVGSLAVGKLQGTCGMGMYDFSLEATN